ncbi:ArsR/SmtB family transcription factor [Oligoflexus tunisiensis]|uniref:ArsR/SmtB family transcription factor n=1 Tax=Oligoflexus tunisiensis TaxID=708132 RepID=UPI000ADD951D|nr:metalloregulator ArsR/SmtB family transcription factor [Oligoflexus tunisiensis]
MNAHKLDLDQILLALADPTRRAILQRLSKGETRVTDLANPFAMSLNSVSKHIRILERARLVKRRQSGREHFLSYDPRAFEMALQWMEKQSRLWNGRLDILEQILDEEDSRESE